MMWISVPGTIQSPVAVQWNLPMEQYLVDHRRCSFIYNNGGGYQTPGGLTKVGSGTLTPRWRIRTPGSGYQTPGNTIISDGGSLEVDGNIGGYQTPGGGFHIKHRVAVTKPWFWL